MAGVKRACGWVACLSLLLVATAQAHDFKVGALRLDHPYATPSHQGTALLCFREIRNNGAQADHLRAASASVAQQVLAPEGQALPLVLPAGAAQRWRHDNGNCLRLQGLAKPLAAGERFEAILNFEKAGEARVNVWVQQPR